MEDDRILKAEIYPFKSKRKPYSTRVKIFSKDTLLIKYSQKKSIELFKADNIENITKEVLQKTIDLTGSKHGFLAIKDNYDSFKYYTVIMDIEGVCLQTEDVDKTMNIKSKSLLTRAFIKDKIIISNDIDNDPRSKKISHDHPRISTFMGIPIKYGQIGLANSESYNNDSINDILPLIYFFENFVEFIKNNEMSISQELKVKEKTSELKDTFIASMSHEMRTPLNGIIGMSRLLRESEGLNEKQQKYTQVITNCSIQLLELVNDVLDFSKISAGDLTLHLNSFNLKTTIENCIDIVNAKANEKGLEVRLNIKEIPEIINSDSRRIKQILVNLLSNAIKFTEKGWVEIRISCEKLKDFKRKIILEVEDTGIGIKESDYKKIFSIFTKAENDKIYSYDNPGAGLGLAINKELCNLMDGDITVKSIYGKGSLFTATFVVDDETEIIKSIKDNNEIFKDKIALVVDDNVDNRIFLMDTLSPWGIHVVTYASAQETLMYIVNKNHFDIIFIDICMPGMSGIELAQKIREKGYTQPMIGLSSLGSHSGENWFDYFFVKPVSKSDLYNVVVKSFKNFKPVRRNSTRKINKNIKILLAEDDYYSRILFQEMLENLGYKNLIIVNNGKQAVEKIKKENFDICFMDIKMPVMNGMEATRQIKLFSTIPIIAVSASVLESDRSLFQKSGMDGYIPKPIDKDQLENVLSKN